MNDCEISVHVLFTPYTDVPCPRCGYPELVDEGPVFLAEPETHGLTCGRCGAGFDCGPDGPCSDVYGMFRDPGMP